MAFALPGIGSATSTLNFQAAASVVRCENSGLGSSGLLGGGVQGTRASGHRCSQSPQGSELTASLIFVAQGFPIAHCTQTTSRVGIGQPPAAWIAARLALFLALGYENIMRTNRP